METNDWIKQEEAKMEKVRNESRIAKNSGTLIGRLLSFQRYDGYACYQIEEKLTNGDFKLKHVDCMDGYQCSSIELLGRVVPKRLIDNYFENQKKTQEWYDKHTRN